MIDIVKLQSAKHTTVKHCTPNKYAPPPIKRKVLLYNLIMLYAYILL